MSQFRLYFKNGEDLSGQRSQSFFFSLYIALAKHSQHFNATLLHDVAACVEWTGQTHATYRNRVAKRTQHVVPNNVARCCAEMLGAFGQAEKHVLKLVEGFFGHCRAV